MIVRTYTRRSRSAGRSCSAGAVVIGSSSSSSASSLDIDAAVSQDSVAAPEDLSWRAAAPFDSQSSNPGRSAFEMDPFGFEESPAVSPVPTSDAPGRALKKPLKNVKGKNPDMDPRRSDVTTLERSEPASTSTSTLMEAQEFGEMMEHVDEVNFALDGLRLGQPVRIRRASLLSLLSVCASSQQRRLLRAQGLVKKIMDAVLGLKFDDSSSTIAAATVLYILAADAQDDHILESLSYIQFLIKLLDPSIIDTFEKPHSFGSRLLGCNSALIGVNKKLDSSSTSIILKVKEILLNCKEIKPLGEEGYEIERPELTAKWIALLTMEKACLSSISFEETSGKVRKVGGEFKEKLREFGGLDAIFSVAVNCHSSIEGLLRHEEPSIRVLKNPLALESVVLLLKCFKIMENATFLSMDNQKHLLRMSSKSGKGPSITCVDLIISSIKILSGLALGRNSLSVPNGLCKDMKPAASTKIMNKIKRDSCDKDSNENETMTNIESSQSRKRQKVVSIATRSSSCASEGQTHNIFLSKNKDAPPVSLNKSSSSQRGRVPTNIGRTKIDSNKSSSSDSSKATCGVTSNGKSINKKFLGKRSNLSRESSEMVMYGNLQKSKDDGYDPYAFDEDDMNLSKWELATKNDIDENDQRRDADKDLDELHDNLMLSISEVLDEKKSTSQESSPSVANKDPSVLEECLLTAIKVLMNLANDNTEGCQKIASCGGLDAMAALITSHFPSFDSSSSKLQENKEANPHKHLNDYELDFLVAILGLLVNLVEKDDRNRSRLVYAKVPLVHLGKREKEETHMDVIPLLCTIFLANQGVGEAAGENTQSACPEPNNDELTLIQGEREAEMMIIEAYAALLLAFLSTESGNARKTIACCLPNDNLKVLVPVLERFVEFHLSLNMISPETHSAVSEVIESCRIP